MLLWGICLIHPRFSRFWRARYARRIAVITAPFVPFFVMCRVTCTRWHLSLFHSADKLYERTPCGKNPDKISHWGHVVCPSRKLGVSILNVAVWGSVVVVLCWSHHTVHTHTSVWCTERGAITVLYTYGISSLMRVQVSRSLRGWSFSREFATCR